MYSWQDLDTCQQSGVKWGVLAAILAAIFFLIYYTVLAATAPGSFWSKLGWTLLWSAVIGVLVGAFAGIRCHWMGPKPTSVTVEKTTTATLPTLPERAMSDLYMHDSCGSGATKKTSYMSDVQRKAKAHQMGRLAVQKKKNSSVHY